MRERAGRKGSRPRCRPEGAVGSTQGQDTTEGSAEARLEVLSTLEVGPCTVARGAMEGFRVGE